MKLERVFEIEAQEYETTSGAKLEIVGVGIMRLTNGKEEDGFLVRFEDGSTGFAPITTNHRPLLNGIKELLIH